MAISQYDQAKQIALVLLKPFSPPTNENIIECVEKALQATKLQSKNSLQLITEIEEMLSVWVPESTELNDDTGHVPWLSDKRGKMSWDFWGRYRTYLEQDKGFPPSVVDRLDRITDSTLEKLEDPTRTGHWDRRGMVVGQVQSGKTANYTGLICKAVDAGYKLIIVLAGMHNSLRSQTQFRLDEGFLGRDTKLSRVFTQNNGQIGVGSIPTRKMLAAHSLTSSADDGDFKRNKAKSVAVYIGSDPVILVVKKNKSVLNNLLTWVQATVGQADESGKRIVHNIPLLLLDDEADNASVNTNPLLKDEAGEPLKDQDVTAINGLIRKLLSSFKQSAYIGYTATPFANIFIYPAGETDEHGEDLFPRSFIINLPTPTNYVGPAEVFGLHENRDLGFDENDGLPIVRLVDDSENLIPSSHKKTLEPQELPPSLNEAIKVFILACAARIARGQTTAHNSMLVHVTRFTSVQKTIYDLVLGELTSMKRRLEFGDGNRSPNLLDELHELWERDFIPTTVEIKEKICDERIQVMHWDKVMIHLHEAAAKIDIRLINGTAADVLDYYDHPNGVNVIVVGGDKLSRGLTLEGLTVSYYLRASRMYDTLMQMGRWFGYRPGYIDLCRLYTSQELADWYRHITMASEELRMEFDKMALAGLTPMDFGLKVQTHPGGLMVTGASKMRCGTKMRVSFAASLAESHVFDKNPQIIMQNYIEADLFLKDLQLVRHPNGIDYYCTDVSGGEVAAFLGKMTGHPLSRSSDPMKLKEYIEKKCSHGELINWTVVLINNKSAEKSNYCQIGGKVVGMSIRTNKNENKEDPYALKNRHLLSGRDEELDLSEEDIQKAILLSQNAWERKQNIGDMPSIPSSTYVRVVRPINRGLLLIYPLDPKKALGEDCGASPPVIGYATSFPETLNPLEAVEYVVNNIFWSEEFGEE